MRRVVLWWLILCSVAALYLVSYWMGWHVQLYLADSSRLTYVITAIGIASMLSLGWKSLPRNYGAYSVEIEWFASDVVTSLGMLGTMIGMMIMLSGTFGGIASNAAVFSDPQRIFMVIEAMGSGLFTALSTTLVGLVYSIILKTCLVVYEGRGEE